MSKKIGVLLSGCGVMDGSEIHEAVLTLLAIDKCGAEAVCMAPNIDQAEVVNHLNGEKMKERRNALIEAARIARGKIKDLKDVQAGDVDAVIMPGGYGAVKTLCNYADKGVDCSLNPQVASFLQEILRAKKPLGAICISPVVAARVSEMAQISSPKLTIGSDPVTKQHLQSMGAQHEDCVVQAIAVDQENKIVSTPAYMLAKRISEVAAGVEKLVREVVKMIK